jgi:hypothetical protein
VFAPQRLEAIMRELVRRRAGFALGILIAAAIGCDAFLGKEINPAFCAGHPDDPECMQLIPDAAVDAPPEGPPLCTANSECMRTDNTGVCDLDGAKMCVQCTETDNPCEAAIPDKPACTNKQCAKCTLHTQCKASNVCLPDGACAPEAMVAYVAPNATGADCTKMEPCRTLAEAIAKNRAFVKIAEGTISDANITTIDGKTVKILAEPGAKLDSSGDGVILEIRNNNTNVEIFDLEITGGSGADAAVTVTNGKPRLTLTRVTIAVNRGLGISMSAGTLTMSRCKVQRNDAGGIQVTGAESIFDISDSIIVRNGHATNSPSNVGGAVLVPNTLGSRFERNTVAFNESDGSFRGGVTCNGQMVVASGNLVFHNTERDGSGGTMTDTTTQTAGACQFGNSMIIATQQGNLGFKSPINEPYDFHLTVDSPTTVRDAAGACIGEDFDGDVRPFNEACDFGADEYHP